MTGNSRSIGRLLLALMAVGFISLIAAGVAAWWVTDANREHDRWVTHTYEVEVAIARTAVLLEQSETARRGYLIGGEPSYRVSYRSYAIQLPRTIDATAAMTIDNPRQQARVAALRRVIGGLVVQRDLTIAAVEQGRRGAAEALFATETNARRMRAARGLLDRMTAEERWLLGVRDRDLQASQRSFNLILTLAGLLLAAVAVLSLLVILRYTRDLNMSRDRLRALNDTLEEQVAERTADLSRANDEIQRFAYIVSHDLRSPLVNVMGFTAELAAASGPLAELVDRAEAAAPQIVTDEARLAAREDLPEAIGFIRTSTQKMDRLINAILKLSREGRRMIAPEPLDLVAIAEGAVGAIRHIIDERGAEVVVERPSPPLVSDRLAVEQILSNLIENATKYLQPGRAGRIVVSAQAGRGRVIVAVADNGRGIDPRDHQRVFDLFRRSGQQDQPGEGIGLAHVRALAYRLGGTIDVQSALGEGATFRLNLPATFQAPQEPAS